MLFRSKTTISLSGLSENMNSAMQLMEDVLNNAKPNETAFQNLIMDHLKDRNDELNNFRSINSRLQSYGFWGPNSPSSYVLSNQELTQLTSQELVNIITDTKKYKHEVLYYGPAFLDSVVASVNTYHNPKITLQDPSPAVKFEAQPVTENNVILVNYDTKQSNLTLSSRGDIFNVDILPLVNVYNNYFSDIVFQELREARGLAYSTYSFYRMPSRKNEYFQNMSLRGTQADKLRKAIEQFNIMLAQLPKSAEFIVNSKMNIIKRKRTNRIIKYDDNASYMSAKEKGIDVVINVL